MKKLPLNRQEFRSLINDNCIYVDKTRDVYRLLEDAKQYFFSRPRRFGKSLLVNTLKELFLGNRELFKGLWIYDKINWEPHPVIHISFSSIGHDTLGLEQAIDHKLNKLANDFGIKLKEEHYSLKFQEIIERTGAGGKAVILIDEYDKPIIDYIEEVDKADENRKILKNFYSVIKDSESYIRFLFITGVSKFSKVSIFSDLNHLEDITIHKDYNSLVGITQDELEQYFNDYIQKLANDYKSVHREILPVIQREYLGYSWDGLQFVYNPYTLIHLFSKRRFAAHWFMTGTPTFLVNLFKNNQYTRFDFDDLIVSSGFLEKYTINRIQLVPLLFQTGYLTITSTDLIRETYQLAFPNKEVEEAFSLNILSEFNGKIVDKTETLLHRLTTALENGNPEQFIYHLKILFKGVVYSHIEDKERYYHSMFYLIVKLIGFYIESEVPDATGRVDVVIKTKKQIIITEFKTATAEEAMKQIKSKEYHLKYMDDTREKVLLAIGFDAEERNISSYLIETVE